MSPKNSTFNVLFNYWIHFWSQIERDQADTHISVTNDGGKGNVYHFPFSRYAGSCCGWLVDDLSRLSKSLHLSTTCYYYTCFAHIKILCIVGKIIRKPNLQATQFGQKDRLFLKVNQCVCLQAHSQAKNIFVGCLCIYTQIKLYHIRCMSAGNFRFWDWQFTYLITTLVSKSHP